MSATPFSLRGIKKEKLPKVLEVVEWQNIE